jgi:hypothetical protein
LLFEPVDALDGETDGAGTVARRGDTALEGVAKGDEARVEDVLALVSEDVGDDFGGVGLRGLLRAVGEVKVSRRRGPTKTEDTNRMTRRPSDLPLTS